MSRVVLFPPFRLDLDAGRLLRGAEPVPLRPKTFATLAFLASRPGRLVTKDELLDAVWPDVAVTEDTPRFSVRELRRALGDDPSAPRYLETVHGRGYRFLPRGAAPANAAPSGDPGAIVVGRRAELGQLHEWWARTLAGDRVVGFVAGDAGIGKTTLVERFAAEIAAGSPEAIVARAECRDAAGADEPYRPLLEALQALAATPARATLLESLRAHAPTWLAQLPSLLDADETAALRHRLIGTTGARMVRELAGWVDAITVSAPLLLVLEDLHWSDRATLDAVAAVAHGRGRARVLLLATYRPVDVIVADHPLRGLHQELARRGLCRDLLLGALAAPDVHDYVQARFGGVADPPRLAAFVHERSEGNPLFMTVVAERLVAEGLVQADAGGWRLRDGGDLAALGIPDTLREMVERQLWALEPTVLSLLEAAAVVGPEFAAAAVAAAVGVPIESVEDQCDGLVRQRRLLRFVGEREWPDGTVAAHYAFRHGLYRHVLYERLPPSRRARLHAAVGERLATAWATDPDAIAAELAGHFEPARDHTRAVEWLHRAAEVAQRRFADREAIGFITRALAELSALPTSEERTQRELMLRMLLAPSLVVAEGHFAPALERSAARVAALLGDLGDTPSHLFAVLALFTFELMRGRLDAAAEMGERALALSPRVAPDLLPVGQLAVGIASCFRGELASARRHLEAVLASALPAQWPISFDPYQVASFHLADRVLVQLGYPEQAVAYGQRATVRADQLGHPFAHAVATSTMARMHLLLREPAASRAYCAQAIALCAEHGYPDIARRVAVIDAWGRALLGYGPEVVDEILAALEAYPRQAGKLALTTAHLAAVEAAVVVGRLDDALHLTLEATRLIEETGERCEEAEAHRWRGEILLALRGREARPEARAAFERAAAIAAEQGARWFGLRAAVSLARLDADQRRSADGARRVRAALATFDEGFGRLDLVEARELADRLA